MPRDLDQLNRNLDALRREVADLRGALEGVADLEREATTQDILERLAPAIVEMVRLEAGASGASAESVGAKLAAALEELGLKRLGRAGTVIEDWPEEAAEELELDRLPLSGAGMIRVEILAPGWGWGRKIIARPVGRVIEVFDAPKLPDDTDED